MKAYVAATLYGALLILLAATSQEVPPQEPETPTNLALLEQALLGPDQPDLKCEILTGEEKYWVRDPRPQLACYADKRGMFFISWEYEGKWRALENTTIPGYSYGKLFSNAAKLEVIFLAVDGSVGRIEFTVENELYSLYCKQPLCLSV